MVLGMTDDRTQYDVESQLLISAHPFLAQIVKRHWEGACSTAVGFILREKPQENPSSNLPLMYLEIFLWYQIWWVSSWGIFYQIWTTSLLLSRKWVTTGRLRSRLSLCQHHSANWAGGGWALKQCTHYFWCGPGVQLRLFMCVPCCLDLDSLDLVGEWSWTSSCWAHRIWFQLNTPLWMRSLLPLWVKMALLYYFIIKFYL